MEQHYSAFGRELLASCSVPCSQVLPLLFERMPIHHFHRPQTFDKRLHLVESYVLCERNTSFGFPCRILYWFSAYERCRQHSSQHTEPRFKPCNDPVYASASSRVARAQSGTLHSSFISFIIALPWCLLSQSQHIQHLQHWWGYWTPPSLCSIATTSSCFGQIHCL